MTALLSTQAYYDILYTSNLVFASGLTYGSLSGTFELTPLDLAALLLPSNELEFNCYSEFGMSGFPNGSVLSYNQMLVKVPKGPSISGAIIPQNLITSQNNFKLSYSYPYRVYIINSRSFQSR